MSVMQAEPLLRPRLVLWAWLLTLLTGLTGACRSAPPVRHAATAPENAAPPSPRERLLSLLPPVAELPVGVDGVEAQLDEAAELLTLEPPAAAELGGEDAPKSAQARAKIEASFETGLRWQDNLRLRAVELVGGLLEGLPGGRDPVLVQAVAALVLEDLAALGFDPSGAYRSPSFDVPPDQMTAAMAQPEVVYSGLAAQLYARCARAATKAHAMAWHRFCEEGRRNTLVFSQALPACTHPSVSKPEAPSADALSDTPPPPERAGVLLQGAFGVPLLQHELEALLAAAHAHLASRAALPMVPLPSPSHQPAAGVTSCAHPPLASQALVARYPGTRWYGLYLQCEADACGVQLCDDDTGCQRASVTGAATRIASWKAALGALRPSQDSVLIESGQALSVQQPRVALEAVNGHGGFRDDDGVREVLAGLGDELLGCQVDHRYGGQWVLAVDGAGAVTDVRAQDDRYLLPLDQLSATARPPQDCIAGRLRQLRFGRAARRPTPRQGASPRRITLSLRIPARLQVEVPLVVRHDARVGPLSSPERLGRDGFAVAFARCAARLQPGPESLGMCVALSPLGRVERVSLDPDPAAHSRALARLHGPGGQVTEAPAEVRACIAQALSTFEWRCRADGAEPGHLALTVDLPRRLLARFARGTGTDRPSP